MATVGRAELPIPGGGDAPVGPGALAELALAIDPHLVQHVADKAERDAEYADAPLHTLVSAANGSLWLKTSSTNVWATISEPVPAWRPITLASGFANDATVARVRLTADGRVSMRGRIVKSDGTLINGNSGIKVGTVPADCVPTTLVSRTGTASLAGDAITGVGRVEVFSADQTSDAPGSIYWYSQDGTNNSNTTGGVNWVGIDTDYWKD
ncbi:hypothetical protein [Streptomyces sp. NPDC002386]